MTTKRIHRQAILEALFTSRARLAVLALLYLNPHRRYYMREIASLAAQPIRAVQRELARLQQAGLLTAHSEGNRRYFQANRRSPVFPELRALLLKTAGLGDFITSCLAQGRPSIDLAFLFGSYARGTDQAASDIDLLVLGEIKGRELAALLAPSRQALGREINPVCMTPQEFRRKADEDDPFIRTVLEEPKLFLIGGEDELAEISGREDST